MMMNFRFTIQYDGARYNGWQRQGNTAETIQGKMEHVLGEMVGHGVEIHGAGRTDAGVHARAQIAHCKINTELTAHQVRDYCNRYLPRDIAVLECECVPERFHARLNAKGKRYIYRLWTGSVPNVFERRYVCMWDTMLDIEAMQRGAAHLVGTHDFAGFSTGRTNKSTQRTLTAIEVVREANEVRIVFEGTGFLHNMVRILAGTLVEIGAGLRAVSEIDAVLANGDRTRAGRTMPPQGLILDTVFYEG